MHDLPFRRHCADCVGGSQHLCGSHGSAEDQNIRQTRKAAQAEELPQGWLGY
jgi:hypothetical protein